MRSWNFGHIDFSVFPEYQGEDLGVFYSGEELTIRIWAPTAMQVEFTLYKESTGSRFVRKELLQKEEKGVWSLSLSGDWKGFYYTFRVNDGDWLGETPGPEARAVGMNGRRGLVFDAQETNPVGWDEDRRVVLKNPVDAVLYELHVRDFSISETSGMKNKGKYLAFTEEGARTADGMMSGIDHLKELGITHVHLLPVADFFTVDESKPDETYNWGYDPLNYNTPEGSYASDPNSMARIREFKLLVQALHRAGIGVILDVVYNHTGFTRRSWFNQTVPGYFYRQKSSGVFSNASGCGNEVATERSMVRKYIIDSLKYWAREYHVDGFRFDLMGIYDLETMNLIRKEMDRIDPSILLYGEGWAADKSPLDESKRAVKVNVTQLDRIAVFNDDLRDAIKGANFDPGSIGFVSGKVLQEEQLKFGIAGACFHPQIVYDYVESSRKPWASEPWQSVNYASCHDNYTLYDKLVLSSPDAAEEELERMVKLAGSILFTSQGIPFVHAGMEMLRTKMGDHNSYKSPDSINQIDWSRKKRFNSVFQYFQQLIRMRKEHPAFRMTSSGQIRRHLFFSSGYQPGVVAYSLNGHANNDAWEDIWIIFNGNAHSIVFPLLNMSVQKVIAENGKINLNGLTEVSGGQITVSGISMTLLIKE